MPNYPTLVFQIWQDSIHRLQKLNVDPVKVTRPNNNWWEIAVEIAEKPRVGQLGRMFPCTLWENCALDQNMDLTFSDGHD